jgi:hypothetical protein
MGWAKPRWLPSALDRRALEEMLAGVGHGHMGGLARMGFVILSMLPRFGNNAAGLVMDSMGSPIATRQPKFRMKRC